MKKIFIFLLFFGMLSFCTALPNAYAADNIKNYIDVVRDIRGENSPEIVDSGIIGWTEVLPVGIPVKDALKDDGRKIAFLTFDDGPSKSVTPDILDILKRYNIKATFFVVGSMARNNGDIIKRIYDEGHTIANHSYSHQYNYIYSSISNLMGEIDSTNNILRGFLGSDFTTDIFRFPGGAFGSSYSSFKTALAQYGYSYINWNVSTGDASGNNVPSYLLINNVKTQSKGNDHIIILMHDLGSKHTTVEALPAIIEYLKSQDYEFKKLI